jgi:hypothetical protein
VSVRTWGEGGLTKGAPMNAMSNGTCFSLVRHLTQGSFANVVIPEKIASAVTRKKMRILHHKAVWREHRLTRVISRVRRLIRKADVSQRYLVFVVIIMACAGHPEGQHKQAKQSKFQTHGRPTRKASKGRNVSLRGKRIRSLSDRNTPPFMCSPFVPVAPR